jgi:hypothetical protein
MRAKLTSSASLTSRDSLGAAQQLRRHRLQLLKQHTTANIQHLMTDISRLTT